MGWYGARAGYNAGAAIGQQKTLHSGGVHIGTLDGVSEGEGFSRARATVLCRSSFMASLLSSAAHVATRHRSSSSATMLPAPAEPPHHTNRPSPPPAATEDYTQRHQTVSSSASQLSDTNSPHPSSSDGDQSPAPSPAQTTLAIEFDGGSHVIVRPDRVVRGRKCSVHCFYPVLTDSLCLTCYPLFR